ncbi:hypothetical protein FA95DRAFT_1608608 [Auriscalpium vulgare]|uniref:Uncharacterized protein n=1 Tax=Auriscalpium vulgare TaxID=40419 RepID=A0ACB8RLB0_9AGAM|nr:hypothetical protein FA95DRAFT_1608608 [Auriscalpium vulgare]
MSSEQLTNFGVPFDDPDGDMLIRSSDMVQFRIFKVFAMKASPIFRSLLSPPDASHPPVDATVVSGVSIASSDGLPVLCLPEASQVLSTFLSIVISTTLPSPPPIPDSLEEAIDVIVVAEKYQARHVLSYIRDLRRPECHNPVLAFSIAWKHRLKEEALVAIRAIALLEPFTIESVGADLRHLTGPCLHELMRCRQAAIAVMHAGMREFRQSVTLVEWIKRHCQPQRSSYCCANKTIPLWLRTFFQSTVVKMAKFTQMDYHHALCGHRAKCEDCSQLSQLAVQELWTELEAEVLRSMQKVRHLLTFDETFLPSAIHLDPPPGIGRTGQYADVILRSSDLVDFRVHKAILSIASPLFSDMFHLPQPRSTVDDELPVVAMEEDAHTLGHLVTALYPLPFTAPATIDSTMALLSALQKYSVGSETDGPLEALRQRYCKQLLPRFMDKHACRAYMLAVRYRLPEETLLAAQSLLTTPITFLSCVDGVRVLPTGAALHEHTQYYTRCRDAARAALFGGLSSQHGSSWFKSHAKTVTENHDSNRRDLDCGKTSPKPRTVEIRDCTKRRPVKGNGTDGPAMPEWLAAQLESMHDQLGAGNLSLSTNMGVAISSSCSSALAAHLNADSYFCVNCAAAYAEDRDALWNTLAEKINQAIREVPFEFSW